MSELALIFSKHVKHNSTCLICGTAHNLNFHHVVPSQKVSEVYKVAMMGDLPQVIDEINKCVTLCAVDHRRVHKGQVHGWLDGRFEGGGKSHATQAQKFMPYLQFLTAKKPEAMLEFYKQYVEKNHGALAPIFSTAGIVLPRNIPAQGARINPLAYGVSGQLF